MSYYIGDVEKESDALRSERDRLRAALEQLMQASRRVFETSISAAQFAGNPRFIDAWKQAESALGAEERNA